MKKIFNLFACMLLSIFVTADGNITIKQSSSNNDPSIVLKVGAEEVKLQEFESIFYKNNYEETISKDYLDEYTNLFTPFSLAASNKLHVPKTLVLHAIIGSSIHGPILDSAARWKT